MTLDLARYHQDGFLIVPDVLDRTTCQALIERAYAIIDAFDPAEHRSVFTTTEQVRTADDWFLGSGDQVRCFLEAEALDATGALIRPKRGAINKIGHNLHELDPVYAPVCQGPALAAIARGIGMDDPVLIQSMVIVKPALIGGEVVSHQDSTFLYTNPLSVTGLWIALEDATVDNGCLWALPGGHREALRQRFHRDPTSPTGVGFETFDPSPLPEDGFVPLEAAAGTVVVLHGQVPHRSGANRSTRSRCAFALHLIEAAAEYPRDNWLQRTTPAPRFCTQMQGSAQGA